MNTLENIIKKTVNEVLAEMDKSSLNNAVQEDLPLGGDEKYIQQQKNQTVPMPLNVSTATWREGQDGTTEKVETKLISGQGTAFFHNHGCIVANHSNTPLKAVCTEMSNRGQRAYYVRLDEA